MLKRSSAAPQPAPTSMIRSSGFRPQSCSKSSYRPGAATAARSCYPEANFRSGPKNESPIHGTSSTFPIIARVPRRFLFHSYHFPPIGGSGAQRPLRMARFLARARLGPGRRDRRRRDRRPLGARGRDARWPRSRSELEVLRLPAAAEPEGSSRWRGRAERWLGPPPALVASGGSTGSYRPRREDRRRRRPDLRLDAALRLGRARAQRFHADSASRGSPTSAIPGRSTR